MVIPDNKRIQQEIAILPEGTLGAKNGQIVLIEMVNYPSQHMQATGRVIHILGEHMAPGMEIEVAILAHGIPSGWSDDIAETVAKIPQKIIEEELKGRTDLRNLPFVTIDGEDAKDFDDAVYCYKKDNGGYQLYVAIADVSHYVTPHSVIDKEGEKRGNSVYFPGKVVPMLPEALSNGICSLNPNVDRLCIVAEMAIDNKGKIKRSRFYRAVIHSKERLTYTKVYQWLKNSDSSQVSSDVWKMLNSIYELYQILALNRKDRGAIDFDTTETKIEFDENRKIQRIVPLLRNDAHRLIEECMLAANLTAARFLAKADIPLLYRVHSPPDEEKVLALRKFLGEFGLVLGGGKKPHPKDYQKTLKAIEGKPEQHLIETVMLRSLRQAQYTESNEGHFGLAYSEYTHFTSPIRRYPDLLVHRAICHVIDGLEAEKFNYTEDEMSKLGKHCSMTERRADDATREAVTWLKCEYMQDKLGQVFTGRITSVTGFGIFVELDSIYVEGLVHITALKNDYYAFDSIKHRLVGERSGKIYRLGDSLSVLVARVDLDERKIDFELADGFVDE